MARLNASFLARAWLSTILGKIMPPYWPDKPHKPAHRGRLDKVCHWLYLRLGRRSRYLTRLWSEYEVFRVLRVISRQQVYGFVANPEGGDPIWYLDAPADVQENRYPTNTCLLRGVDRVIRYQRPDLQGLPDRSASTPRRRLFRRLS